MLIKLCFVYTAHLSIDGAFTLFVISSPICLYRGVDPCFAMLSQFRMTLSRCVSAHPFSKSTREPTQDQRSITTCPTIENLLNYLFFYDRIIVANYILNSHMGRDLQKIVKFPIYKKTSVYCLYIYIYIAFIMPVHIFIIYPFVSCFIS